jgi:nicotinate-nucleotide adenylyltransferase
VLGAAFNPPHEGHLALAERAASQLGLERVMFVPTGEAPHKRIEDDPGPDVRVEMTRLAAASDPRFDVSTVEVERDGPSYSYETMEILIAREPDAQFFFLMGADAAAGLEDWRRPERLIELARLAIAGRPGVDEGNLAVVLERLGADDRVERISMAPVDASSSLVRERVAAGQPIDELVPAPIAGLIAERGLYSG